MKYTKSYLIIISIVALFAASCSENKDLLGTDLELFKSTPVWELAKAVRNQDVEAIKRIISTDQRQVDFQEPKFGESLLLWAVWTNHYKSVKALLEGGANPNLPDHQDGRTPFMFSAQKFETSSYLKLLLENGGNVNFVTRNDSTNIYTTPLITAAYHRQESVKLLIDAGANVNYIDKAFRSALSAAFTFKKIDIVRYLLIDKGADYNILMGETFDHVPITITTKLRSLAFPLDSREYKVKMEVVNFLQTKGVDYFKEPIPSYYNKQYSEDYLQRY